MPGRLDKVCLEIIRTGRAEQLTFGRLKTHAEKFAVWLAQAAGLAIGDKVAILGTPGGSRIITMVLLGALDFAEGKEPSSWVSVKRFHHQFQYS